MYVCMCVWVGGLVSKGVCVQMHLNRQSRRSKAKWMMKMVTRLRKGLHTPKENTNEVKD